MPLALLVLALSAFAIGTTEFVIMGLLPDVARSLAVSLPSAGWLISGYALGVAIGAPIMAVATAALPRKRALLILMGVFIVGNLMCAVAADYGFLMFARVVTALCHGAFFGIGSVVAASLVPENRKASAVALMFTGLTLANVLGVPLGTALGQFAGWRTPFWAVAVLGVLAFVGLARILPSQKDEKKTDLRSEFKQLGSAGIWAALATTTFFSAAMFALFTYVAPLLEQVTQVTPRGVTWTLFLIGLGLTLGNYLGGRLADWRLGASLTAIFMLLALATATIRWTSVALIPAEVNLFIWAMVAFAAVPGLQINVMIFGKAAPNLVATLNIGAFNVGNALGAWVGGMVIAHGLGLQAIPIAAGALALVAVLAMQLSIRLAKTEKSVTTTKIVSPAMG
ncbi:MFS transporter [Glaciimonas sp. Gout2]|uniref:MFS transporter n=1 Tax=unclassified Glaciimonas TaxID=2644401 RepID=UPI002AB5CE01|nr:MULTISPECIES: MFS transporter [unclassified Glaciimonas]MDY7548614.1 MFS transporter [Glaciimonas sp. CA11.2]MEB0014000.1 MFS transporter [Glaciimonas sp. Cout2]MEB0084094.1 MFS transporter [Glaciimonas sp. Gout2]